MGSTESTMEDRSGHRARRSSHRQRDPSTEANAGDDPWWWEIENENLILNQVPNVSTATVHSERESENGNVLSDDFNTLLKIGEHVNLTLSAGSGDNKLDTAAPASATESATVSLVSASESESEKSQNQSGDYLVTVASGDEAGAASTARDGAREQTLEEFKEELRIKRLARQTAVQDLRDEIATLRKQLADEQALTQQLRSNDAGASSDDVADGCAVQPKEAVVPDANVTVTNLTDDIDDEDPMSRGRHANIELANAQLALQLANSENISLRAELGVVQKQVFTLKEVITCCKQMLSVKEEQCDQLKAKLQEIETSLGEREMKIMSSNLREEYERQLGNIRQLRQLYEERQRIATAEQENLQRLISIKKDELLAEKEKTKNSEERIQTLLKEIENVNTEMATLREECNEHKFEKRALKEEMGTVNTLFSQMVMGFNGKNNLDIDRLTVMLEENRTLLNDMATKEASCSEGATLPKLLFELVEQATVSGKASGTSTPTFISSDDDNEDESSGRAVNVLEPAAHVEPCDSKAAINAEADANMMGEQGATASCYAPDEHSDKAAVLLVEALPTQTKSLRKHHRKSSGGNKARLAMASGSLRFDQPEVIGKVASAQEIIGNLPKVWKVLMELLSHHKIEQVHFEENGNGEDCYKSVESASGPKPELSVSKTYIKLKDLILEKKSLVKETNRLKTLNSHLDYRLNEQEKRLSTVSLELTKTWHLVGKMQRQHRQLHTQEQILRYQLQQKRRLLTELKDELEYCRRKWAAARAKNDESQEQCNDLRREFAKRKLEDANNSAESGYSDEGPASDEEAVGAQATVGVVESGGGHGDGGGNGCRKHLKEMFEHTRKIKRMQSTSPGRAGDEATEILLRWNSAPPTCGWRANGEYDDDDDDGNDDAGEDGGSGAEDGTAAGSTEGDRRSRGAIPKRREHGVRKKEDTNCPGLQNVDAGLETDIGSPRTERATRIQRLEEQCKSLIQQVLETSDNRERLEVQLCRFQDEIAPVQYAVPLDEFINKKRLERMTRASSAPATGTLTPREEEYTRKRSERLGRLEEESRQLMSRIKRTSDRGHYLRCSLDRIRRAPSREGSFESNTEDDSSRTEPTPNTSASAEANEERSEETANVNIAGADISESVEKSPLTAEEEAYTARRSARLQRLEEESRQLINKLSRNSERGNALGSKLDTLHEQFRHANDTDSTDTSNSPTSSAANQSEAASTAPTIEERIGDIEKISSNRDERLRILEEEGKQLLSRLSSTSERGTRMINRIAEREHNRQLRSQSTPSKDVVGNGDDGIAKKDVAPEDTPVATVLMPTLKNVACASIVDEELNDCVTVTTTSSQIAAQQGAVPKSKPTAQLSAAVRAKASKKVTNTSPNAYGESLEEMVKRLRDLPFPGVREEDTIDTLNKSLNSECHKKDESTEVTNDGEQHLCGLSFPDQERKTSTDSSYKSFVNSEADTKDESTEVKNGEFSSFDEEKESSADCSYKSLGNSEADIKDESTDVKNDGEHLHDLSSSDDKEDSSTDCSYKSLENIEADTKDESTEVQNDGEQHNLQEKIEPQP